MSPRKIGEDASTAHLERPLGEEHVEGEHDEGVQDQEPRPAVLHSIEDEPKILHPVIDGLKRVCSTESFHRRPYTEEFTGVPRPLKEIQQQVQTLASEAKEARTLAENFMNVARRERVVLEDMELVTDADIALFSEHVNTAAEAIGEVGNSFRSMERIDASLSILAPEEVKARLQTVGAGSMSEARELRRQDYDEMKRLQHTFSGLGTLIHGGRIKDLHVKIGQINDAEHRKNFPRSVALEGTGILSTDLSGARHKIAEVVVDRILERYRLLFSEQRDFSQREGIQLTPEQLSFLSDQFIEQVVRPAVEQQFLATEKYSGVFKKDVEQGIALIRDYESIAPRPNVMDRNHEQQQLVDQNDKINTGFSQLNPELRDWLRKFKGRSRNDSGPINNRFQDIAAWIDHEKEQEYPRKVDEAYQDVLSDLWNTTPNSNYATYETNLLRNKISAVNTEVMDKKKKNIDFLENVDVDRFNVYLNSPLAQERYSAGDIQGIREFLGQSLLLQLEEAGEGTDGSFRLGSRLMQLHQKELAPKVILNAFRENGRSGERPFISIHVAPEQTALFEFITNMTAEEEEVLRAREIPGVTEIVELIRENPSSYRDHSIRGKDGTREKNPIQQQIDAHLATAGQALFNSKQWQERFFALDLLKNVESDISESHPAILELLKKGQRPEMEAMAERFFSTRIRNDVNLATSILENYASLPPEEKTPQNSIIQRRSAISAILKAPDISEKTFAVFVETYSCPRDILQKYFLRRPTFDQYVEEVYTSSIFLDSIATHPEKTSLFLQMDERAPLLMHKDYQSLLQYVLTEGEGLIARADDLDFLNTLVGRYSKTSESIVRDYQTCLKAGAVSREEKELVLEVADEFRVLYPEVLKGYRQARGDGTRDVFVAGIRAMTEKMTGKGVFTAEERTRPQYQELLRVVYANNAGTWGTYEGAAQCDDRSSDIEQYQREPVYVIDLLSGADVKLKEGQAPNAVALERLQQPILDLAANAAEKHYDPAALEKEVGERIHALFLQAVEQGSFPALDVKSIQTPEDKLTLLLTDSQYGKRVTVPDELKRVFIGYEFAKYEDVRDYVAGTTDRVSRANNRDYALLCELNTFFTDRVKEVNRRLIQGGWENPQIAAYMEQQFQALSQRRQQEDREGKMARQSVLKLGVSEGFINQMRRALRADGGKDYSPSQVRKLIRRYEATAQGLTQEKTSSKQEKTRAVYGQLRSQRERTRNALRELTGQDLLPADAHLENIDIQGLLEMDQATATGEYDPEKFAAYTAQRFIDVFRSEREVLTEELAKFESTSGHERTVLNGYITKSKESANARMVGGVCVSVDNPDRRGNNNIWDMENYFQLVLQDPETNRCQGLVLLHRFEDQEKKILTASFNPSSTYTYSVDETALFRGLAATLETFAQQNEFDVLAVSKNKNIRTNRRGGTFERAMDERVGSVGKSHSLTDVQSFSYHPVYQLQDLDVIWERPDTRQTP